MPAGQIGTLHLCPNQVKQLCQRDWERHRPHLFAKGLPCLCSRPHTTPTFYNGRTRRHATCAAAPRLTRTSQPGTPSECAGSRGADRPRIVIYELSNSQHGEPSQCYSASPPKHHAPVGGCREPPAILLSHPAC